MDSFPSRRASKLDEARQKQDAIVALLERIAKLQGLATSALPSQKKFREMQVRDTGWILGRAACGFWAEPRVS